MRIEEQNRGDGSCRVSREAAGLVVKERMASRSKDDFSLDSPFIEQLIAPERNQLASHPQDSDACLVVARPVNSIVGLPA